MRDYTKCTFCKYNNRKIICKKGRSTSRPLLENGKQIGIKIGPEAGKCKDYEEDLIIFGALNEAS